MTRSTISKMMILVAGLVGVSASQAAAQAGGSIIATATVLDMGLARATHQAAKSLGQVVLQTSRLAHGSPSSEASVRRDVGPATIFAGKAELVTIAYW